MRLLEAVNLTVDEFEAVRLADLEGLYQENAAEKMRISRQTFGRILDSAHKKIADALVNGKALSIEGGNFQLDAAPPPQGPPPHFGPGPHRGRGRGRGHCGGHGMNR
jgi:predicted DNA-binding protein (UPF0251 family)